MSTDSKTLRSRRRVVQHILWPVVVVVIVFGWQYPVLGFAVPAVMLMGVAGGLVRGRYVCGHLCPRGSFFDRVLSLISFKRPIPSFFRDHRLRWALFVLLMAFMLYRIALNPGDLHHWGRVFWLMCTATTAVGLVLGIFIHPRAWCAFCPMGTLQAALDRGHKLLRIDAAQCIACRACEKSCPINLSIISCKDTGKLIDSDCFRCPECRASCPTGALTMP